MKVIKTYTELPPAGTRHERGTKRMTTQRLKNYLNREERLKQEIGQQDFSDLVDAISKELMKRNLDKAPTVLGDLLEHIKDRLIIHRAFGTFPGEHGHSQC
jgi:hypothetical protein